MFFGGLRRTPLDRDPTNLKERLPHRQPFFASALQLRRVTIFDEILYKLCHRRLYSIVQISLTAMPFVRLTSRLLPDVWGAGHLRDGRGTEMTLRRTVIAAFAAVGLCAGGAVASPIEGGAPAAIAKNGASTFTLISGHHGHGGGKGGFGGGGGFRGGHFGGFRPGGQPPAFRIAPSHRPPSGYPGSFKPHRQPNFSGIPHNKPYPGFRPPLGKRYYGGKPPFAGGKHPPHAGNWHHRRRYWRNGRWYWYGAPLIGYGAYSAYDSCYWSCINDGYGPAYCTNYATNYCD
ncbi:hypothetical protein [Rhodomicrobium lacus]|uniref:hypothetical protein n=1 Tax=Rhodomicrobium lacus TaxID=2498452 RepID=UPI000F8E2D29|nr:hypothetical protein [Rhodomicrobium lacus]